MTQIQNKILKYFEFIFSLLSLLHISQAIIPILLTKGSNEGDGVDVRSLDLSINAKLSVLIYIVVFILLAMRWKRTFSVLSRNILLLVLLGVVVFSCFWSVNPDQTLRFSIYAVGATGFGLYIATRYTLSEQLRLLTWLYGSLLILSVLFALLIPSYGLMSGIHEGALRGVFTHKNQFGAFMAPGGVVFMLNAFRGDRYSWLYWGLLILNCGAMVMSQSTTAIGTFGVMLILCMIYRIFRWRYEVMVFAILSVTILGLAMLIWISGYVASDSLFSFCRQRRNFIR